MKGTVDVGQVIARAEALLAVGRGEDAIDVVASALGQNPHDAELLARMAALLYDVRSDLRQAALAAQAAIAADPTQVMAFVVLSYVHRATGNEDAAIAAAREAVRLAPDAPGTHLTLARALATTAPSLSSTKVLPVLDRVLALAPHDAGVFADVASLERLIGQPARARRHIEQGLALDPTDTTLRTMRAGDEVWRGDAVTLLQGVLSQRPTDGAARRALADLMWNAIARLASGVWWFVAAVVLLSMWIGPDTLGKAKLVLFAPLIFMWIGVFQRLRRQLPPGYFRRRVATRPEAWIGLILAFLAALIADLAPVLLTYARSSAATRGAYVVMLLACVLAGLAHLSVNLGRARRRRTESTASNPETIPVTLTANLTNRSFGLGLVGAVPLLLLWPLTRWAAQPGALSVLVAVVGLVVAILAVEAAVITVLYRPGHRTAVLTEALITVAAGIVLWWMFTVIGGYDFAFAAPSIDVPDFRPIHITPIEPLQLPPVPGAGG